MTIESQVHSDRAIMILGGVGPSAGIALHQKITELTDNQGRDQGHLPVCHLAFPHMIPDRTAYLLDPKNHSNPAEGVIQILREWLNSDREIVLGIPCNTIHASPIITPVIDFLENYENVTFVHLIESVKLSILQHYPKIKRVGILGTTGTIVSRVYHEAFESAGLSVVTPSITTQEEVIQDAIYHPEYGIKARSEPVTEIAYGKVLQGMKELHDLDAEVIVLACTELPLAYKEVTFQGIPVVNTIAVLAEELIHTYSRCPSLL